MKKFLLFITITLQFSILNCLPAQTYPFVKYDANVMHYDSSAYGIQHFLSKWNRVQTTGQGSINIVHIGGSHVQAGVFPHRVRTNLLTAYPSLVGGRGLVFPYSAAAKCNNPHDYKVHCMEKVLLTRNVHKSIEHPLGLCGIAVTAHDTFTRIQLLNNESRISYPSSHIVVLGYSPQGVIPRLSYRQTADGMSPADGEDSQTVFPSYIDTATRRYIFNLRQEVDSFDIILPCGRGETFTLTGVSLGNRKPGVTYHSIGVNGAAVPDYLKCQYLTTDLRLVRPDLVIFGIGINDANTNDFDTVAFKNNYLQLCDSILSVNANCAFIFITNNDSYRRTGRRKYAVNRNGMLVRDVCYRLAAETGGAVWDQFEIMGGLKSMQKWQTAGLARRDKVHFTRAGYELIGDLFYEAFAKMLDTAPGIPAKVGGTPRKAPPSTTPKTQKEESVRTEKPREEQKSPAKPKRATIEKPANANSNTPATNDDRFPYISQ